MEQEHQRLLGLSKQVQSMEVVNSKGIEQLRQVIVKVHQELERESARLVRSPYVGTVQPPRYSSRALVQSLVPAHDH